MGAALEGTWHAALLLATRARLEFSKTTAAASSIPITPNTNNASRAINSIGIPLPRYYYAVSLLMACRAVTPVTGERDHIDELLTKTIDQQVYQATCFEHVAARPESQFRVTWITAASPHKR